MSTIRGSTAFDQLPPVVKRLIVANITVFLLQMVMPANVGFYLGLTPQIVMTKFWIWQIITYSFLHGSGWHLFFNMFALWMFGPPIESFWGSRKFLVYYFTCTLGAAAAQFVVAPASTVIGASGGIYGLLLAFGLLMPDAVMYLFFVFPVRAIQAVFFIALMTLASAVSSGGARIAHFSHLGGMITGFFFLKIPHWLEQWRFWRIRHRFENPLGAGQRSSKNDLAGDVDRILEKISSKGVESLTEQEHELMRRYAEEKK